MVCQQNKQVPNDGLGQLRSRLITFYGVPLIKNPTGSIIIKMFDSAEKTITQQIFGQTMMVTRAVI